MRNIDEFIAMYDDKVVQYYEYIKTLLVKSGKTLFLNIVPDEEMGPSSNATLSGTNRDYILKLKQSLYKKTYHLIHELKHLEFNTLYPIAVYPLNNNNKLSFVLAKSLNNFLHHRRLEIEIDSEFKFNRLKSLKKYNENFKKSDLFREQQFKNNTISFEYLIDFIHVCVNSLQRRVNYENRIKYHICTNKPINDLAEKISNILLNNNLESPEKSKDTINKIVYELQKYFILFFSKNLKLTDIIKVI